MDNAPWNEIRFSVIDSTNSYIKRNLHSLPDRTVVISDMQTRGRGRGDNKWFSYIKGNLYISLLFKRRLDVLPYSLLFGYVVYLLIKRLLYTEDRGKLRIKYPNDIYFDGKKMAGILIESGNLGTKNSWLIVGIGINVVGIPKEMSGKAISIKDIGSRYEFFTIRDLLVDRLVKYSEFVFNKSLFWFLDRVNRVLVGGKRVVWNDGNKEIFFV